mgnify:CR=1 FL=1
MARLGLNDVELAGLIKSKWKESVFETFSLIISDPNVLGSGRFKEWNLIDPLSRFLSLVAGTK